MPRLKVHLLKVVTLGVRGAIHTNSLEELESLQIPQTSIKKSYERHTSNNYQIYGHTC
jgi:hypothetical protein